MLDTVVTVSARETSATGVCVLCLVRRDDDIIDGLARGHPAPTHTAAGVRPDRGNRGTSAESQQR